MASNMTMPSPSNSNMRTSVQFTQSESYLEMSEMRSSRTPQTQRGGASMFAAASHVNINGGTFINNEHRGELAVSHHRNEGFQDSTAKSRLPRRSNVLYEEHLRDKDRGQPLWIPQPNLRLPIPYRIRGVCIGDVGIITHDGAFEFLFNICLPAEDPVHCEDLPENFSPLDPPLSRTDIREFREYEDGSYLASPSVTKVDIDDGGTTKTLAFQSSDPEGAILTMPEGAYMEELNNISRFRDHISLHKENWYKFVNGPRGREANNGNLRVVIGVLKSTAWGIAIFSNPLRLTCHLEFQVNPRYDEHGSVTPGENVYSWKHFGATAEFRTGPAAGENDSLVANGNHSTSHPLRNQCLFVRTLGVVLSDPTWKQLHLEPPVEVGFQDRPTSSTANTTAHLYRILNDFLPKEVPGARMPFLNVRARHTESSSISLPFASFSSRLRSKAAKLIRGMPKMDNNSFNNGSACLEGKELDDCRQMNTLVSQVYQLMDGNISLEQYLFGGQGGGIQDISDRRRTFLDDLQHSLLQDFLVEGVDLPTYFQDNGSGLLDTISFLEDIRNQARTGIIEVTSKYQPGIDQESVATLIGHPHRLLSLNEVIHLAGTGFKVSNDPGQKIIHHTETIEAFRSRLHRYSSDRTNQIRIVCMMRLGGALLRRFWQFRQRQDLDEAIFWYMDASVSASTPSLMQLEAFLGLCESLYQRLLLLGNLEDLIEIVKGFNSQTLHDLSEILKAAIDQLRDPPKQDGSFFGLDPDRKSSLALPSEPTPPTTSLAMPNRSAISYDDLPGHSKQVITPPIDNLASIHPGTSQIRITNPQFSGPKSNHWDTMTELTRVDTQSHSITSAANLHTELNVHEAPSSGPASTVQMFASHQNYSLQNTTINHYVSNYQNDSHYHDGLSILSQAIATDALHDSGSTLKCHPGTRQKLIACIHSWIKDADETCKDILWIHGPPGSGKSTIMQSIAELCFSCELEKRHPGGIFFARRKPQREDDRCLYSTLSYSLSQCIPALQDSINHIMVLDPTIPTQKPDLQLRKLIFEPLMQHEFPPTETPFFIIDGLDECKGHDTQTRILNSIVMALKNYGRFVRFIITSRSEAHIRDVFDSPEFKSRTQVLPFDNLFDPKNDIRLYLEESFEEITRLNTYLKTPWYQPSDIDYLVEKSSGQFLYAATVVGFVNTELTHPAKQLEIVLKPSKASFLYSNIDILYTQILETIPDKENLLRIFGLLLTLHCPQPPEVYDDILGLQEVGGTTFILRGLHSIIRYPHPSDFQNERRELERRLEYDKTRGLRFYHASFPDFLVDRERSKHFFVDLYNVPADLVKSGFKFMTKWISCPWRRPTGEDSRPNRETWGYLKHHMGTHLAECRSDEHAPVSVVQDLLAFQARLSFPPPTPIESPIWDHSVDALHSMVTACALILDDEEKQQNRTPTNFHSEHSHWAQDCSLDPSKVTPDQSDRFGEVYIKYCALLDKLYQFALSSSSDVLDILDKLPGLVTDPSPIVDSWLHSLFRIDRDDITATMEPNAKFFHRWNKASRNQHFDLEGEDDFEGDDYLHKSDNFNKANHHSYTCRGIDDLEGDNQIEGEDHLDVVLVLSPHFVRFLCDQRRAGKFYRDPELRSILDYSHIISMIFSPDWLEVPRSRSEVTHLDIVLRKCLESISLSHLSAPPDGHPIIQLVDVLKALFYDLPCLQTAPVLNVDLVWSATRRLLEWIQRQHEKSREKDPTIIASHRIRRTLAQISVQIYKQILQIHDLDNGGRLVAICKPFLVAISRDFESETPPVLLPPPTPVLPGQLVISETLLSLNGIRSSLLAFLTKPERSKQMYFSPEVYHTQFAEICLEHCDTSGSDFAWDWRTLTSYTEWRFHLVRARPTDYILNKLSEIPFGPWLAGGQETGASREKMRAILAIVEWLEEHKISEHRPEICERWRQMLHDLRRLERWKSRNALLNFSHAPNSPNFHE